MEKAESFGIQVVPIDILDEFEADASTAIFSISKKNMAPWGTDVRIGTLERKKGIFFFIGYNLIKVLFYPFF